MLACRPGRACVERRIYGAARVVDGGRQRGASGIVLVALHRGVAAGHDGRLVPVGAGAGAVAGGGGRGPGKGRRLLLVLRVMVLLLLRLPRLLQRLCGRRRRGSTAVVWRRLNGRRAGRRLLEDGVVACAVALGLFAVVASRMRLVALSRDRRNVLSAGPVRARSNQGFGVCCAVPLLVLGFVLCLYLYFVLGCASRLCCRIGKLRQSQPNFLTSKRVGSKDLGWVVGVCTKMAPG